MPTPGHFFSITQMNPEYDSRQYALRAGRLTFHCAPVLIIAGCLGACASSAADKIVITTSEPNPEGSPLLFGGDEITPVMHGFLEQIRVAFQVGDETRCMLLAGELKKQEPPGAVEDYLAQLTGIQRGRQLMRGFGREARIDGAREEATIGDLIQLKLILPNVEIDGKEYTIEIPKSVGGIFSSKPRLSSTLLATMTMRDLDAYGGESTSTQVLPLSLQTAIELQPASTFTMEFQVEGTVPRAAVARILTVSAELIPCEVLLDGKPVVLTRIPFAPARIRCLPSGYEASAGNPLDALKTTLDRPDPVADRDILPTALLVTEDDRSAAVRLLSRRLLNANQSRGRAIIAALLNLTGDTTRGLDRAAWLGFASSEASR